MRDKLDRLLEMIVRLWQLPDDLELFVREEMAANDVMKAQLCEMQLTLQRLEAAWQQVIQQHTSPRNPMVSATDWDAVQLQALREFDEPQGR